MFASFQVTSAGVTNAAPPRARLTRSDDGCWPCRKKRKKCDGVKPICARCRSSYRRDPCTWPTPKERKPSGTESRNPSPGWTDDDSSKDHGEEEDVGPFSATTTSQSDLSLLQLGVLTPPAWQLPDTVVRASPDLSFAGLLRLSLDFQQKALGLSGDFPGALLLHTLPASSHNAALLHAWIACSILAVAAPESTSQQKALVHRGHALKGLRGAIETDAICGEEERAIVLMLHVFETLGPTFPTVGLSLSHLKAAHRIFDHGFRNSHPSTPHDALLLEAYILRTTLNCLVHGPCELPLDHINQMTRKLETALQLQARSLNRTYCPWIGAIGPKLTDHMWRLSWFAHHLPLCARNRAAAMNVRDALIADYTEGWREPEGNESDHNAFHPLLFSRLYWHATSLLAELGASTNSQSRNVLLDHHFHQGSAIIEKLCTDELLRPALLWALIVLGTLLQEAEQLQRFKDMVARISMPSNNTISDRVLSLLEDLYALRTSTEGPPSLIALVNVIVGRDIVL